MKNYTKLTALLLSAIFLCGCTGIQTTIAPPTVEPSSEPVTGNETVSPSIEEPFVFFEEDGKYYLDVYRPGRFEFIKEDTGFPYYGTELVCSSLDELLEKW